MKKTFSVLIITSLFFLIFVFPFATAIADGEGSTLIKLENPFSRGNNLYDFLKALVVDIIIPLGGVIVVMAVIYSGFLFVTAQGNEEQLKRAKRAFTYTAIGAAILLGAWTIALVIENTIGAVTNISP